MALGRVSSSLLMMILVASSLATNYVQLATSAAEEAPNATKNLTMLVVDERNLNEEGTSSDDKNEALKVIDDLQNNKRKIFAIGPVNSKTTLLISGAGGGDNGYMVGVADNDNGVFHLKNLSLSKLPSSTSALTSDPVVFVCLDSTGSKLVSMSESKVSAVTLPDGAAVKPGIADKSDVATCFRSGEVHLAASSQAPSYYAIEKSSGRLTKFHFDKESIETSDGCATDGALGFLCTGGTDMSLFSHSCTGKPIADLVSGYVGPTTAFLFDASNTVYAFPSALFSNVNQSVAVKKVTAKEAWPSDRPTTKKPKPISTTEPGKDTSRTVIIAICIILAICIVGGIVFYCWHSGKQNANKGGKGGKGGGGKGGGGKGGKGKGGGGGGGGGKMKDIVDFEDDDEDEMEELEDEGGNFENDPKVSSSNVGGGSSSNANPNNMSQASGAAPGGGESSSTSSNKPKMPKTGKSKKPTAKGGPNASSSSRGTRLPPIGSSTSTNSSSTSASSKTAKQAKKKGGKLPLLKKNKSKAFKSSVTGGGGGQAKSSTSQASNKSSSNKASKAKSNAGGGGGGKSGKSGKSGKGGKSGKSEKSGKSGKGGKGVKG